MIQPQTIVRVTDNSGARIVRVFKVLGGSARRYARIGDEVACSVQTAEPRKEVKKKQVVHAVVVRQKKPYRRKDGSYISFSENAVVIVDRKKKEPLSTRIFGPVPRELDAKGYRRVVSMAPEVV
ncbi:MAG: 50S ribosomal protein L14 [Candidatus Kaiserbacteria bacterium]|nr:50S ribosomal protein L14 [Candidatus Kaiserbacteria bacterium]